jgi:transcription antitermination factor NusG
MDAQTAITPYDVEKDLSQCSDEDFVEARGHVWYCFLTEPKKEREAARQLYKRGGFPAFVPLETYMRRKRGGKSRQATPITYPMLTGYVFAGFDQPVNWYRMFSKSGDGFGCWLYGVVGFDGLPAALPPESVDYLWSLSGTAVPHSGSVQLRKAAREGDYVRIASGAFVGWEGRVEGITGDTAEIMVELFNRQVKRHEPLENLAAA